MVVARQAWVASTDKIVESNKVVTPRLRSNGTFPTSAVYL